MGEIRKATAAEQREWALEQQDPRFLAWVGRQADEVAHFLAEDVPAVGALKDPYSVDGLQLAVSVARNELYYPDYRAVLAPENAAQVERFGRFAGEVFIRNFEGEWVNSPSEGPFDIDIWPMVRCQGLLANIGVLGQVKIAVGEGHVKGETAMPEGNMVWLYNNAKRRYLEWAEAGRPDAAEWSKKKLGI
ncbi:hypothetical protein [Nocardia terpenica]|uniref:Uncharacterized protein n=1 Tax=Nocardia terpenica TaxID=455432 RepID=A0A6G9Z724_9NOCA|nr:hypothetical protein [Nocardia terpenica]QIS21244.1 hypothetical protein F6W96_25885 [Nocardia terpenica]